MTVAEFCNLDEGEATSIIRWRFSQLTRSGYSIEQAVTLATELRVDLHAASDLVARGCPPPLAIRILL